jgi:urea transport system permease protein
MLDGLDAEGSGNMAFPRAGTADQHHILGRIHELTAMELTDQGFADLAGGKVEAREVLVGRKAGRFHVIRCRAHLRFLGYSVEGYKLFVFTLSAVIAGIAGALYYPQAGIINPDELAPIASIYLAVWVAIGGRGRLYGAVIGAALVSLMSTWFTGGRAPDVNLGFYTIQWVEWWTVFLGIGFVLVTLFAPKGLGGLVDLLTKRSPS